MFSAKQDVVFHVVWVICWFIASVEWAVVYNRMRDEFDGFLKDDKRYCHNLDPRGEFDGFEDTYVQAAIAVVGIDTCSTVLSKIV